MVICYLISMKPTRRSNSLTPTPSADRLDSWKAISTYLTRDIRTAQRWEKHDSLPIHRHSNSKHGAVFAFKSEIDLWWKSDHHPSEPAPEEPTPSNQPQLNHHTSYLRGAIYALIFIVVLMASSEIRHLIFRTAIPPASTPQSMTLAVLPFENLSSDVSGPQFAGRLARSIAHSVGNEHNMQVISVSSDIPYIATRESLHEVALNLHSQAIIRGTVQYSGRDFQATVELINGANGLRLWSSQYQQVGPDLQTCVSTIMPKIATELRGVLVQDLLSHETNPGSSASASTQHSPGN